MKGKEILGNLIIAGGILTAAKAGTDLAANKKFWDEQRQETNTIAQVNSEYGVTTVCATGMCADVVRDGNTIEEKQAILDEYYTTLRTKLNEIPRDPIADRWGLIDSGLILGGLAAAGVEVTKKVKSK